MDPARPLQKALMAADLSYISLCSDNGRRSPSPSPLQPADPHNCYSTRVPQLAISNPGVGKECRKKKNAGNISESCFCRLLDPSIHPTHIFPTGATSVINPGTFPPFLYSEVIAASKLFTKVSILHLIQVITRYWGHTDDAFITSSAHFTTLCVQCVAKPILPHGKMLQGNLVTEFDYNIELTTTILLPVVL